MYDLRSKGFFSSPKRPDQLWGPPRLIFNWYRRSFPGVRRQGRDVDYSLPSSAEVKNKWSYKSTSPVCLHRVHKDNVTSGDRPLQNYDEEQQVVKPW